MGRETKTQVEMNLVPVFDKDGSVLLNDMYTPTGEWMGSRRTVEQCADDYAEWERKHK